MGISKKYKRQELIITVGALITVVLAFVALWVASDTLALIAAFLAIITTAATLGSVFTEMNAVEREEEIDIRNTRKSRR